MTRLTQGEVKYEWDDLLEGIPEIKKEAYFSFCSESLDKGTGVHNVL